MLKYENTIMTDKQVLVIHKRDNQNATQILDATSQDKEVNNFLRKFQFSHLTENHIRYLSSILT